MTGGYGNDSETLRPLSGVPRQELPTSFGRCSHDVAPTGSGRQWAPELTAAPPEAS
jgi:hypothetical protein